MKRIAFLGSLFLLLQASGLAQPHYTLQQCIDTALAKNIGVQQSGLLAEAADVNMKQARANLLPDLNATLDHGINTGRSIDPFTNGYVNQSINYASYGASSGVVLFNGLNLHNQVRQYTLAYDASRMELQQAKDNLTLNVILAYLQVLNNEDLLSSSLAQKTVSDKQLERLTILDKQGAISPSQVTDVKGQLMNDELSILNMRNNLETAKLSLAQLMNVPYDKGMTLERMNADEFLTAYSVSSSDIYQTALQQFSLVKSVELRTKSSEYALKAARSRLFPTVTLGGSMQTNYSSVAQNSTGKIPYNDQIRNNVFYSLNLGVRIPIFNSMRSRNNIRLADIAVRNNELTEENTKLQLRQQIEQAHLNMTNAYDRYKTLLSQVEAYQTSFKAAEARFTAGVGTSVDYVIAKNNLDRANINLIAAKYDFVLRKKILDYYQNAKLVR
ncbi:TolC family protein [Flavisolibacter nicotianae]|uniref:TolC family protein n=1 Tax=Flavisolibacter nicotianae TaxID=2364882 RepID=UPI000EB3CC83|nr:TolC family protein [Flavisolibacter nicotianae]